MVIARTPRSPCASAHADDGFGFANTVGIAAHPRDSRDSPRKHAPELPPCVARTNLQEGPYCPSSSADLCKEFGRALSTGAFWPDEAVMSEDHREVDAIHKELDALHKEVESLHAVLDKVHAEVDSLHKVVDVIHKEIEHKA